LPESSPLMSTDLPICATSLRSNDFTGSIEIFSLGLAIGLPKKDDAVGGLTDVGGRSSSLRDFHMARPHCASGPAHSCKLQQLNRLSRHYSEARRRRQSGFLLIFSTAVTSVPLAGSGKRGAEHQARCNNE